MAEFNAVLCLDTKAKKWKYKFKKNVSLPRVAIEPTTSRVFTATLCGFFPAKLGEYYSEKMSENRTRNRRVYSQTVMRRCTTTASIPLYVLKK